MKKLFEYYNCKLDDKYCEPYINFVEEDTLHIRQTLIERNFENDKPLDNVEDFINGKIDEIKYLCKNKEDNIEKISHLKVLEYKDEEYLEAIRDEVETLDELYEEEK